MKSLDLLKIAVKAADGKRAEDIVALNMEGISLLADYFVMMTGSSERQLDAIVDAIEDAEEEAGLMVKKIEGKKRFTLDLNGFWRPCHQCLHARRTCIIQP